MLVYKKIKFTLEQATIAQRGKKIYSSTLSLTSALDGVGGQHHAPAAVLQERPGSHYVGSWVDLRSGLDRCGKSRPPPGFSSRTIQPV